jgi:hypothetical protein
VRYVILRDDDTNAFTPVECLEHLYRPFLDRGLPVNLATIPNVLADARREDGKPEGFLLGRSHHSGGPTVPIASNPGLTRYLRENPGYRIVQHGYRHEYREFERARDHEVPLLLEEGTRLLQQAGFPRPDTFVAPHDKFSPVSLAEVARRFRVVSTGWFEWRRLPASWWIRYARKKLCHASHWRVGQTVLLSHPGCLLSCYRSTGEILERVISQLQHSQLTVLVTHWWEYFPNGEPNRPFIELLHQTADFLAGHPELRVVTFSDVFKTRLPLN